MVIWLIGLSGAGKTTVGQLLYRRLKPRHANLVFFDGDLLREVWGDNLGHTIEARRVNAHRISHMCRLLDRQDIHVVAAVLSGFSEWQTWNRANFTKYFEVFLDVPMDVLRERDTKSLYARAESGEIANVIGVDLPFPRPAGADLVISGADILATPSELAGQIEAQMAQRHGDKW
ncbi:MAG TPA: adenylyl-sulfate kinase [Hyphomicrobiaceae bacterium]|nr:adenylyl-sulfate kinase [Hyphomicrobiaceae bacterium]